MRIYLYDIQKAKNVQLNLAIEYSLEPSDLYVVFITKNQTCDLKNGKKSSPFTEFYFKKVNHIVSANINYEKTEYCLTIGYYLSSYGLVPFIIDQVSYLDQLRFDNTNHYDDNYSKEIKLFNYKEYSELMELGLENLSFKEYITRIVDGEILKRQNELYRIPNIGSLDFISKNGLDMFLEEEERK